MSDNWDSYFCTVEDKPASIVVNFGLAAEGPDPEFPALCYISVFIREPDEQGFPGLEEEAELAAIEDSLVESFHAPDTGLCAGHCLTDGKLDVFFYLADADNWADNAGAIMERFPDREWETAAHDDPDWELFFGFLYPDDVTMLSIQNRRVYDILDEMGDDPTKSRLIEHWADFPSQEKAETFGDAARSMGYTVESIGKAEDEEGEEREGSNDGPLEDDLLEEFPPKKTACCNCTCGEEPERWQAHLSRPDRPEEIDGITLLLFGLAREHDGEYGGWACPAVSA